MGTNPGFGGWWDCVHPGAATGPHGHGERWLELDSKSHQSCPADSSVTREKGCYRFWIEAFTSHDLNAVSFPSVVGWPLVLCPQIGGECRRRGRYTNFYQLRGTARSRSLSL
jgi:hypothetical protein